MSAERLVARTRQFGDERWPHSLPINDGHIPFQFKMATFYSDIDGAFAAISSVSSKKSGTVGSGHLRCHLLSPCWSWTALLSLDHMLIVVVVACRWSFRGVRIRTEMQRGGNVR